MLLPTLLLVLGQASQPNEWSTFPPAGGAKQNAPAKSEPKTDAKPDAKKDDKANPPDDAAKAKYREAADKIAHSDFGGATALLNQLAAQYPKWAAIFSARCIAQAGLKYPQFAVEDCNYSLSLEPNAPSPLWWLAASEEALGRKADAAKHYQQYADLRSGDVSPTYREQALKKAKDLGGGGAADSAPAPEAKKNEPAVKTPPPAKTEPTKTEPTKTEPAKSGEPAKKNDNVPVSNPSSWNAMPATAPACNASGECQNGQQCKDRGDGTKACMGNGKNGAFCAVSKDCVFPGKCKHRHDGVNVCMGGGGAGAFCDEGSDCTGGLWCRDRGDGVKTCATK